MPNEVEKLLEQVKTWCAEKWGRQSELAKAVSVTRHTVSDWIHGRKRMTLQQFLDVKEFLGQQKKK